MMEVKIRAKKKNSRGSNAKKVEIDGITFASGDEGRYYEKLKADKKAGLISDFELQPRYVLQEKFRHNGKGIRKIGYDADFLVRHNDGSLETIDVKGFVTPDAKLKHKMFYKTHPHLKLTLVSYVKKYGGWVELEELKKLRKANNK